MALKFVLAQASDRQRQAVKCRPSWPFTAEWSAAGSLCGNVSCIAAGPLPRLGMVGTPASRLAAIIHCKESAGIPAAATTLLKDN